MKKWLISEYYYPVVVTTGYYVTEIAEYFARKGADVNVISSNNKYYDSDVTATLKQEEHNGVKIYRSVRRQIGKDKNSKRIVRLLSLSFSFLWMALRRIKKGDEVIILTNPAFFMLMMPMVRFFTGCKYHILVHDIFPENLVSIGKVQHGGFAYKVLKGIYNRAYAKADSCIAIGHDMKKVLEAKVNCKTRVGLITNWSDVDEVKPMPKVVTNTFKKISEFAKSGVVFQFAGNLGKAQGLDNLMAAIDKVTEPEAKFLFVGAGAKLEEVNTFAESHSNTLSLGFVSRSEQNDFLNACDIGVVTLADGMYGLGVPSKSYNIMATGRPILYIGELDSEIALCIEKYKIGWVVKPNDPEGLAQMIGRILQEKSQLPEMGKRAREVAENVFGKNVVLEQYYQYLEK